MEEKYYTTREIKKIFRVNHRTSLCDQSDVMRQIERVGKDFTRGHPVRWRIKSKSPYYWITAKNGENFDSGTNLLLSKALQMAAIALSNGAQVQIGPTDVEQKAEETELTPI